MAEVKTYQVAAKSYVLISALILLLAFCFISKVKWTSRQVLFSFETLHGNISEQFKPGPKKDGYNNQNSGIVIEDVVSYNKWLSNQRKTMLDSPNNTLYNKQLTVAREFELDYFQKLAKNEYIATFALYINSQYKLSGTNIAWAKGIQTGNISFPRQKHYPIGLETGACDLYVNRGFAKDTVRLIGKDTCQLRNSPKATIEPFSVNSISPFRDEYARMMQWHERIYMHMVPNARVSKLGIVVHGSFYIEPLACAPSKQFNDPDNIGSSNWLKSAKYVDEVFVSVKFLSHGYFHWNVEDTGRLALYIDFLKQNPSIKILITEVNTRMILGYLKLLGFEQERVVWGNVVGKMVYLPQGARCGEKVSPYGLNIASSAYASYMSNHLHLKQKPDTIILIHRSKKRFLGQHKSVQTFLKQSAKQYNLRFVVFSDEDLPSFHETIKLFNRAALVVAPHGAGLVNTIFSQPGTIVIEVMCPHAKSVLCYSYLMRNLGHIYYGIRHDKFKEKSSCQNIWVDINALRRLVNYYLSVRYKM